MLNCSPRSETTCSLSESIPTLAPRDLSNWRMKPSAVGSLTLSTTPGMNRRNPVAGRSAEPQNKIEQNTSTQVLVVVWQRPIRTVCRTLALAQDLPRRHQHLNLFLPRRPRPVRDLLFLWVGLGLLDDWLLGSPVAGLLGIVLGHELALLGGSVELAVFVIDLSACVYPDHSLGLSVGDFLRRRRGSCFDWLRLSAGLGLRGGLWGGCLSHSSPRYRESRGDRAHQNPFGFHLVMFSLRGVMPVTADQVYWRPAGRVPSMQVS